MKSTDIKERILRLARSDPDGFGLLAEQLGNKEWQRCASHAAGFLSSWFYDQLDARIEDAVAPERQLADALAEQLRGRAPHNGYEKDVLARHARLRGKT